MRRVFAATVLAGAVLFGLGGVAVANPTGPVTHPGQHGQDCGLLGTLLGGGRSSSSPGSPFVDGVSGGRYAGETTHNSANGQASQYDVARFQQCVH
jgi:hypothetical protein